MIPRSSPSSRSGRIALVVSDRKNMVMGESNRCRCLDLGMTTRIEKNATVCTHQFTFQAVPPAGNTPHSRRYVTISAVMRTATRPDVAEGFPRAFGRNTKRRNESPAMPTITANAQTAANAPYQPCVGVAFSSPRTPRKRCSALTQAKTRNPQTTAA